MISWRRGEQKFAETEAQRRARARERSTDSGWPCSRVDRLDVLTAVPPVELPEFDGDRLMEELDAVASLSSPTVEETLDASAGSSVSVDLSPEQSSALYALPLFSMVYGESVPHTLLQLKKAQDHRGMTLQFSLHTQVIPEMISLKGVCRQLKVGRWTIMQLIRRQELRCYRIAHRYRITVEDVKKYLERTATY